MMIAVAVGHEGGERTAIEDSYLADSWLLSWNMKISLPGFEEVDSGAAMSL